MRFSFTVQVSGLRTNADHYEKLLFEAGCDDALIAVVENTLFLDFEALRSATLNIEKAGGKVGVVKQITPNHSMK